MSNIPIRDITLTGVPTASAQIAFDDGQMKRGSVSDLADGVRPVASQSEAEAGADNVKVMTPLRVDQAITAKIGVSIASKAQGDLANTAVQSVSGANGVEVDSTVPTAPVAKLTAATRAALIPAGGVAEQTIIKNSATDNDVRWGNPPGGGDMVTAMYDPGNLFANAFDGYPIANRSTLAGLSTTAFTTAYLRESGREGTFLWNGANLSTQVTADAEQGIYVPPASDTTGASGSWARVISDSIDPRAFGAVAGPYSVGLPDSTAAFQAAINMGIPLKVPYTGVNSGFKVSSLTLLDGSIIEGDSRLLSTLWHTGDGVLLDMAYPRAQVRRLYLNSSNALSGSMTFRQRSDLRATRDCEIEDITTDGSYLFFSDVTGGTQQIVGTKFRRIVCATHRGLGFQMFNQWAYLELDGVLVDYIGSADKDHAAYDLRNNQGARLTYCDVTGGVDDALSPNNNGFYFDNCAAVWMGHCQADTCGGVGLWIAGRCSDFHIERSGGGLCAGHQIVIEASTGSTTAVELVGCYGIGRSGLSFKPSGKSGLYIGGGTGIGIVGGSYRYNSNQGVYFGSGAKGGVISAARLHNNESYGLYADGAGSLIASGSQFFDNTLGSAYLVGTNKQLRASINGAGSLLDTAGSSGGTAVT